MLERIQRDLFALGARLADPAHQIAGRVTKAAVVAGDDRRGSSSGSTRSKRSCRRCDGSSSRADRTAGATLHVARTVCRRAERAMVALAATTSDAFEPELLIYVNRLSDLLFVMARSGQPSRGHAGNRVVSARARDRCAPMPTASGWRVSTTRTFRSPRVCCPRRDAAARRRRLRVRAHRRRHGRRGRRAGRRAARRSRRLGRTAARGRARRAVTRRERHADVFLALRAVRFEDVPSAGRRSCTICSARSGRTSPSTRYATWDDLLDYCRRSANPVGRLVLRIAGYDDPALDAAVRRRLHGAAAHELLAGSRRSTGARDGSTCQPRVWQPAGAREADLDAAPHDAGWRAALRDAADAHARAVRRAAGPSATASSGRLRFELRATWLGGMRILDKLEAADFDVFAHRPALGSGRARGPSTLAWQRPRAESRATATDGPRHQLLLLVPRAPRRQAARDRRRLGFLPRGGRCGGRGARTGTPRRRCTRWRDEARALLRRRRAARRRRDARCSR